MTLTRSFIKGHSFPITLYFRYWFKWLKRNNALIFLASSYLYRKNVVQYQNQFLGQFWRLDENEMMINKADLWEHPIDNYYKGWSFSRKYLWADKPDFKNTYILSLICSISNGRYNTIDPRRRRRSADRMSSVSVFNIVFKIVTFTIWYYVICSLFLTTFAFEFPANILQFIAM